MSIVRLLFLALCGASSVSTPLMADLGGLLSIPLPPAAERRLVSADIVQNGQRLSIATLRSRETMDETITFYRDAWAAGKTTEASHPAYVEPVVAGWQVISRLQSGSNLVVQLREGRDGVEGFLSALSLESIASSRTRSDLAASTQPAGSSVLSSTEADDTGSHSTTTVVQSHLRTAELVTHYRDELTRRGWKLTSSRSFDGTEVGLFERLGQRLDVVIARSPTGESIAILNEVYMDARE